jgi:hypothetical protein
MMNSMEKLLDGPGLTPPGILVITPPDEHPPPAPTEAAVDFKSDSSSDESDADDDDVGDVSLTATHDAEPVHDENAHQLIPAAVNDDEHSPFDSLNDTLRSQSFDFDGGSESGDEDIISTGDAERENLFADTPGSAVGDDVVAVVDDIGGGREHEPAVDRYGQGDMEGKANDQFVELGEADAGAGARVEQMLLLDATMRGRERDDSRLDNFIAHDALSSLNLTDSD